MLDAARDFKNIYGFELREEENQSKRGEKRSSSLLKGISAALNSFIQLFHPVQASGINI